MGRRAKREGVLNHMTMRKALHQMPAQAGRGTVGGGEAVLGVSSDEARLPRHETVNTGQGLVDASPCAREHATRVETSEGK
jgi:hypothetical protein